MSQTPLSIRLIDCGSKTCTMLSRMIEDCGAGVDRVALNKANEDSFHDADGMVISGGPHLFTDKEKGPKLREQFAFLKTIKVPVLGVCLGHQAIGLSHGASIFLGETVKGKTAIEILSSIHILKGLKETTLFEEDHQEGITLPQGFTLLASSDSYKVEAMAHTELPLFGVQFHPEISGEKGLIVIRNFLGIVENKKGKNGNY